MSPQVWSCKNIHTYTHTYILHFFYSFGDQYVERFQYILIIDENTSLQDLQMTLMQALLFRLVAIAYEVGKTSQFAFIEEIFCYFPQFL